ncbi:MAG: intradiol ring-cleavage dioxygenase [Verrucomicrobia bacterium]|nr:intradiol ring-cleavage dioxygenase [Verrucomicrobiota bacterium]MBI3867575.1 intradiol ring-cleavage dioxygenase [Verrucomicrobiota bacterium]
MNAHSLTNSSMRFHIPVNRRRFLQSMALATAGFTARGALAEALTITPRLTEGPYYPDRLPLDQDNDLLLIGDSLTPAVGVITHVRGRVLDKKGDPVRNALVELWQADGRGAYLHSGGANGKTRDAHFQGYGKFLTGSDGGYKFRTVKAGLYMGRTRHLHFGVTLPGRSRFTTQLFWREWPKTEDGALWSVTNAKDSVLGGIEDAEQRASVIRPFTPVEGSATREEQTTWDIVMGFTPSDR